jgi:hypothetical protein
MDTTRILHELAAEGLPVEAIEAAREHRGALAPAFVQEIERFVAGDHTHADALFLVFHLLGEWREKSAYRPLGALLRLPGDDLRMTLAEAVTETSHRVMAAVFDGDPAPLHAIIRDPDADEYIRSRMCEALAMVTLRGEVPREATAAFLRDCFRELAPQDECFVWDGWQSAIAMLGLVELVPLVRQAFEREFIAPGWLSFKHFEEDLAQALAGGPRSASDEEFDLFGDTIEAFSSWSFARPKEEPKAKADRGGHVLWRPFDQGPAVNPYRNVGRNDPCPCGSGKKFKKCCLGKVETEERERAAAARFRAEADRDPLFAGDDIFDESDDVFDESLDGPIGGYDADIGPDPAEWLALDEHEKLRLVKDYHRRADEDFPRPDVHGLAHVVVENQVAMGDELPVRRKLEALMDEGLDRHAAIHAIGAVLMMHINDVMNGAAQGPAPQVHDAYFAELEALTAESWRRDFG